MRKKSNTVKEYPFIKFKEIFPYKIDVITALPTKEKEKENISNDLDFSMQEKDLLIMKKIII